MYHPETEASLLVKMDDIAGVKTNGAHSYYLVKRSCQSYITEQIEKDSYSHTFPANHKGHYLEIFKETKDGDVYYLDDNKAALISCVNVVGICPDLDAVQIKRKGKMVSMNLVNN